jgi:hypothetical protein
MYVSTLPNGQLFALPLAPSRSTPPSTRDSSPCSPSSPSFPLCLVDAELPLATGGGGGGSCPSTRNTTTTRTCSTCA